jgi:hypothetical protein
LADFYPAWRKITANKTVLSYISGAKILFTSTPTPALSSFAQPRFTDEEANQVDQFVEKLRLAQVISVVPRKEHQIVSPIFLTTNHDGSLRLIFNMKKINKECISTTHFKLETLQLILPLIPRGAWFTSWDLVQGFYNVLVHASQRHFFCFDWRGERYQFRALPMGCAESPRIFSKVVRAVVYRARALGINVFSYLDDTLTFDLSFNVARQKSYQFADLLTEVGFLLHKDKSVREPTQRILFLGFIIDSVSMTLEIPHEKFLAIQELVREALDVVDTRAATSLRFLARVVGKLISVLFLIISQFTLVGCLLTFVFFLLHLVAPGNSLRESPLPGARARKRLGASDASLQLRRKRDVARLLQGGSRMVGSSTPPGFNIFRNPEILDSYDHRRVAGRLGSGGWRCRFLRNVG